ncbi:MAG: cytochrome c-type biogenesis protein CcmH [Actinomycetota bacterium]|nr:cytochrome c-type biogenesis protein CcmH [Actinomycetota bacterium]
MRRLIALAVALSLVLAGVAWAQEAEPRTTLPDVEDEVMCPVCGTTLELATEAPQANRQRELIRGLIAEGMTKEEIKDVLVAEYGPEVLAVPDTKGFDLVAWLAPGAAILAAGVAIFLGLRRWRRDARADAAAGRGGGFAEAPLGEADAKRLDADLKRYEP